MESKEATEELVGYCAHAREGTEPPNLELRESGWLFARKDGTHLVVRIDFGRVAAVHEMSFNAFVLVPQVAEGDSLKDLAQAAQEGNLEIADFVTSDGEVARAFLRYKLRAILPTFSSDWKPWQLARLLQTGDIVGQFEPVEDVKTRPIL